MTDAHCHLASGNDKVRELLIGRDFLGIHPWECLGSSGEGECQNKLTRISQLIAEDARLGVGEIGLDRLKQRTISDLMRELFVRQLELAFRQNRSLVLHGAKCWGQVVAEVTKVECRRGIYGRGRYLFHGFSRSDGLIPEIARLGGFISVGPAILNDHAVNYREMVKKIPDECLLVETDRTQVGGPTIEEILIKLAEIRGVSPDWLEAQTDWNAKHFIGEV